MIPLNFAVLTKIDDMIALEPLVQAALAESRFADIPYAPEKFRRGVERAAADVKRHGVMAGYVDARPIGFAYCSVGELLIGKDVLLTTVHAIYVSQKLRKGLLGGKVANGLLNGVLSWSKARSAREVMVHATFGIDAVGMHRFMKRRGFGVVGGNYDKTIY
jgi:hypothetical protein